MEARQRVFLRRRSCQAAALASCCPICELNSQRRYVLLSRMIIAAEILFIMYPYFVLFSNQPLRWCMHMLSCVYSVTLTLTIMKR